MHKLEKIGLKMTLFAENFFKIGCVIFVIGLILAYISSKKPDLISQDFYLAFLILGTIPIFFMFFEAISDFFCWIWRLFK